MITTMAVSGYRSLRALVLPLGGLTVVRGANGSGKSSVYQAFRLLARTAEGGLIPALARAGGLQSVLWAGPEIISGRMRRGEVPVQGTAGRSAPISLALGFASDLGNYLIDIGQPVPSDTLFTHDPEIKRELVWVGPVLRPAATLVERRRGLVKVRGASAMEALDVAIGPRSSILSELADPIARPELTATRRDVASWRFYDSFRTDAQAPARAPQVGTYSPVLDHDGANLAAAIQTILESAWSSQLNDAVADALPGTRVRVDEAGGWFSLQVLQPGLLRPLTASELSDGTLRFLLLATALTSPQPPGLLVVNEPESSLHPDVVPALARLIVATAQRTQVVVVTHATALVDALRATSDDCVEHELVKDSGETLVVGQEGLLSRPRWEWGRR